MSESYVDDGGADEVFDDTEADFGGDEDSGGVEAQEQHQEAEEQEGRAPRGQPDRNAREARQRREQRQAREIEEMRNELAELRRQRAEPRSERASAPDPFERLRSMNIDDDPMGAIEATRDIAMRLQSEREQQSTQERERSEQQAQVQRLASWAGEREADFREENPDYDKAAKHLQAARVKELKIAGASDPEAAFKGELLQMVAQCRQTGRDPADAVYKLAKARGFKVDNGGEQVQQRQGQRGVNPLAGTGTRSGQGGVSVESVANAPKVGVKSVLKGGDQFDKDFAKLKDQSRRRA